MTDKPSFGLLEARITQLAAFLEEQAPYVHFDQRHLDANTPEQAYWHLGYRTALMDALTMLKDEIADTVDTSSPSPGGDQGE